MFCEKLLYLRTRIQSITDTFGEQCFGLYTEVAFVESAQTVHLGPGCLTVIEQREQLLQNIFYQLNRHA